MIQINETAETYTCQQMIQVFFKCESLFLFIFNIPIKVMIFANLRYTMSKKKVFSYLNPHIYLNIFDGFVFFLIIFLYFRLIDDTVSSNSSVGHVEKCI